MSSKGTTRYPIGDEATIMSMSHNLHSSVFPSKVGRSHFFIRKEKRKDQPLGHTAPAGTAHWAVLFVTEMVVQR